MGANLPSHFLFSFRFRDLQIDFGGNVSCKRATKEHLGTHLRATNYFLERIIVSRHICRLIRRSSRSIKTFAWRIYILSVHASKPARKGNAIKMQAVIQLLKPNIISYISSSHGFE